MKRLTSILALMLAGVMLICALPLSAGAYGTADGKLTNETFNTNTYPMFQHEIDDFLKCIRTGEKLPSHIDQFVITSKMMQAIYDSSDAEKEIDLR